MSYQPGKYLFGFIMSKEYGPAVALELRVHTNGALRLVRVMGETTLSDLNISDKIRRKDYFVKSDVVSICHGKPVVITAQPSGTFKPADFPLQGTIVPIEFKSFQIAPNRAAEKERIESHNRLMRVDDADCLFVFDPASVMIEGTISHNVTATTFVDGQSFDSADSVDASISKYVDVLKAATSSIRTFSADPDIVPGTVRIVSRLHSDCFELQCTARSARCELHDLESYIITMMRERQWEWHRNAVDYSDKDSEALRKAFELIDGHGPLTAAQRDDLNSLQQLVARKLATLKQPTKGKNRN